MGYRYPPVSDLKKLLEALRTVPADSRSASDEVLGAVSGHLLDRHPTPTGDVHWFCEKADSLTREAAAFSLRLFAYNSPRVTQWKEALHDCLSHCASCVAAFEAGKITWQNTYFGAFEKGVLTGFFVSLEQWELSRIVDDIGKADTPHTSTSNRSPTSLPCGTLYRIMSNWIYLSDSRIQSYLQSHVPPIPIPGWPEQSPPAFALVLLIIEDANLRAWAKSYLSGSSVISKDLLATSYSQALSIVIAALDNSTSHPPGGTPKQLASAIPGHIRFAEQSELWSGIHDILRLISPEWFQLNVGESLKLRRMILSHLRDPYSHFTQVFDCFNFLLKRLGKDLWMGEGPEYPQMIFESIKDNPEYHKALEAVRSNSGIAVVTWYLEYLSTLRNSAIYGNTYKKVVEFLSAEASRDKLQHSQPNVANILMNVLNAEYIRLNSETKPSHRALVEGVIDNCADIIISAAYGTKIDGNADWVRAQSKARELAETVLEANVKSIQTAIRGVSEVLIRIEQKGVEVPPLPNLYVQENMWKMMYSTLQSCSASQKLESKALAKIICIISKISHIAPIRTHIFSKKWDLIEGDNILKAINRILSIVQNGLSDSISAYSNYGASSNALEVLQCKDAGRSITILLLSPVDDFRAAAQTLIGLAFDVDGRMECFRSLFANLPSDTFEGIFQFLRTFCHYANFIPEACSLSTTLVRCFADILDVLCSSPDGLLHRPYFLKAESNDGPAARMLQFWKQLTEALSLIYKRTPTWARHVDTPDMVIWMRDALILARDVLKQWGVIENAASAFSKAPTKPNKNEKISVIGAQMVESLQEFLPELLKWLRLTDEELLHQSFALLISVFDVMKESHIVPSPAAITKLSGFLEAKSGDESTAREQPKTRLDQGRLSQLSQILQDFGGKFEEDEIEIISHTLLSVKPVKDTGKSKESAEKRPYIQGKNNQIKPVTQPKISTAFGSSSRSVSSKFSEKDQHKLEASIPQASFRKSQPIAGPSKLSSKNQPAKLSGAHEVTTRSTGQSDGSTKDEDESEEEDSDDDSSLVNLGKIPSPKKVKQPKLPAQPALPKERRQIKVLDLPLNAKPDAFTRQRQHAPIRPRPDCSGLHKTILSWNYNHTGPVPPGRPLQFVHVPNQFRDYKHYIQVFQPLLLVECWAQILAAKEERRDSYQCRIESRQYVDNWIDLDLTISEAVKKDWYLAETDIVLIKHASHEDKCIMAKVKSYRALMSGIQLTVRCFIPRGEAEDPGLTIQSLWQISKIFSLSTLDREYRALLMLEHSDMCQFIMQPRLQKVSGVNDKDLLETMRKYKVNEPQATAILKALKTNGVSLIQGPPGTGKTSTICGLIAQFIANRPRPIVTILPGQRKGATTEDSGPTRRVLVCAPSNAAIDELAQRIRDGRGGSNVSVVRIGPGQTISSSVRDISLDYLVDQKLDATPNSKPSTDIGSEIRSIRQELDAVKNDVKKIRDELQDGNPSSLRRATLENELKSLNSRRQNLNNKLDQKQDQRKSDSRAQDTARRNARQQVLSKADIICSTLAGAGHESLDFIQFDLIVIDEAAQAIELSSLIPLKDKVTQCVMVGDPQQLPPTVISPEATRFGYNQSLFVRLQRSNVDAVHLLSIQYRMHPDISCLPSRVFYDGRLLDGPDMATKTQQPWHGHDKFGTYKFLNISWGIEEKAGRSLSNAAECSVAADLFQRLRGEFGSTNFDFRVGVVSMYKAQIQALRKTFQERFGNEILRKIDFNTVDGFQGQEKDIIILSCVRAGPGLQRIGFTADVRRMNVALTRAKSSLFILGNAATLERSDDTWRAIVQDARSRESLVAIDATYYSRAGPRPVATTSEPMSKKRKVAPVQAKATTLKLSTPQEFKAAAQASTSALTAQSLSHVDSKPEPSATENGPRGTKRSADSVDQASDPASTVSMQMQVSEETYTETNQQPPTIQNPLASGSSTAPPLPKPTPNPRNVKRPQKAAAQLFIPKSHQGRRIAK